MGKGRLLKTIVSLSICLAIGCVIGFVYGNIKREKRYKSVKLQSEKHLYLFKMMVEWMMLMQEGKSIKDYVKKKGYKKIAVFGISYVGDCLIRELKKCELDLLYGIDNSENTIWSDVSIFSMKDKLEDVDAIIVTAVTTFEEIKECLQERTDAEILSLEDIIFELRRK